MRVCRYKDEDFVVESSFYKDYLVLHCEVTNWNLTVLKRMYKVFGALRNEFPKMMTITPNPNFAKLFGGETVEYVIIDGQSCEVIVWDTK